MDPIVYGKKTKFDEYDIERLLTNDGYKNEPLKNEVDFDSLVQMSTNNVLSKVLEFCISNWRKTNETKYQFAATRVLREIKDRWIKENNNSLTVTDFIKDIISKRIPYSMATRPEYMHR